MCGRTACALEKQSILSRLRALISTKKSIQWKDAVCLGEYIPAYNKAPGSFNPIIMSSRYANGDCESNDYVVQEMRWGLIPSFILDKMEQASNHAFATSSARADTLLERPAYRNSVQRGWRCIIVSQGFYEWRKRGSQKQPFFISMSDSPLMFMAGLFSMNKEHSLYTYTVITTDAVNVVSSIHDRMPIIFNSLENALEWIDASSMTPAETCFRLSKFSDKLDYLKLTSYPVNPAVNSTKYDCPACIEPYIEERTPKLLPSSSRGLKKIDMFFTKTAVKKIEIKTEEPMPNDSRKRSPSTEINTVTPIKKHFKPENL